MLVTLGYLGVKPGSTQPPPLPPPPPPPDTTTDTTTNTTTTQPPATTADIVTVTTYYPPESDLYWKPEPRQDPLYLRQITPAKVAIVTTPAPAFDWNTAAAVAGIAAALWMLTQGKSK